MLVTQQKNRTDDLCLSVFLDSITPNILNQGLFCFFFKKAHVKTGHTGYIYSRFGSVKIIFYAFGPHLCDKMGILLGVMKLFLYCFLVARSRS